MTAGWISHPLAPALRVVVEPPPPAAAASVEATVERLWAEARAARPSLFNGRVFAAREIAPERITGFWTDYKHALAQIREPSLFAALAIRALAVNGVVEGPDGIVFGRRDPGAIYQPGLWQCPPAGSVEARRGHDTVDLRDQLLAELAEELGMPAASVSGFHPLAAVEHPGSHVVDVGIALRTDWDQARIAAAHAGTGDREYVGLAFVPRDRVAAQLDAWGADVVPPARVFIAALPRLSLP